MTTDHLDDDALSAHLDGEATPEEAEHVETCAACTQRLDALGAAARLLGTAPPVDDSRREAAIAAALAAAPVSLAERRRRKAPPGWLVGAAAAVLAVGVLVPVLGNAGDDDADQSATAESSLDAGGDAGVAADEEASTFAAPTADAVDLGEVAGQLAERVRQAPPAAASSRSAEQDTAMASVASCEPQLREGEPALGVLHLRATATYEGQPAEVLVFQVPDRDPLELRAIVVAAGDCATVLADETFPA